MVLPTDGHLGTRFGRRPLLKGAATMGLVPAVGGLLTAAPLLRARPASPSGARTGEVTTGSAVVWSRAAAPGEMTVRLRSGVRLLRTVTGPVATPATDLTSRVHLTGLAPGREYEATVTVEGVDGAPQAPEVVTFRTAPLHAAEQTLCWSGDTCGQGWGIDRARGGLATHDVVRRLRPDLFVHCGDTIYADEPMEETVALRDGSTWRNELTDAVTTVAETLEQFRGRHRYALLDEHVRALHAEVPMVVQWDDHETTNNWYPGEVLDDDRYGEKRVDVLATRGRRAWQEHQPVPVRRLVAADGDGFAPERLYRRVPRGQHLDLFCLDMRSHRGPNPDTDPRGRTPGEAGVLGARQEAWLVDSLRRSRATWKVVSADLPLSIPSSSLDDLDGPSNGDDGAPLGREPEMARVLSALKRHGVRNVVLITADVHYTAAHHYDPSRATFTDFDPFWEFVSGPLASQPFAVKDHLDQTFGPEVVFAQGDTSGLGLREVAPRPENQYVGHLRVAATGELTVSLHDGTGAVLWRRTLEPDEERPAPDGPSGGPSGPVIPAAAPRP